ncbi:MAG: hypothetical protein K8F52_12040 [Candidatus Scalindua rubra]|uniref:Serine proteinase HtrA/DegQ/DegS family protein n=1 Tax=Candidatus Scalindua brodae TaxID=237368 RepID=A0A0B0EFD3_9BACT|nr:MAG: serine proteinase HtrA/DegQ/DegS family protein [Candidatus Scalindua brodae]MBZ0109387.1 hypothetical protein [Candidatus Scalindua rubra]TWU34825.1 hypothetical protein S225a_11830 [Candidatus Brocadiaceae bacterium S225]
MAKQFGAKEGEGVVVTEVKPGSIAAEFKSAVEKSSSDRTVLLLLKSGNMQQYVVLSW